MIQLQELSVNDGIDVYNMLQRIGPSENAFRNDVNGMNFEEFKEWLELQHAWSLGERLPEGYVKQWSYWLIVDEKPVGYGKLRERVTEKSKVVGGNIGYAVDPVARGKGYGNKLFEMLLIEASKKHIKEIFSTIQKYNYSSKKVHEKFGGKLIDEDEVRWYFTFDLRTNEHPIRSIQEPNQYQEAYHFIQ